MTFDVNPDTEKPLSRPACGQTVAITAEHTIADVALRLLVETLGYRATLIDLDDIETLRPDAAVVIVRTAERVRQIERVGLPAGVSVIGLGVAVAHLGGIEVPDSTDADGCLEHVLRGLGNPPRVDRVHLSEREQEVIVTYALGSTVRATARRHFLAESTVRTHFRRVTQRYIDAGRQVNNKTQLLIHLIVDGWVSHEQMVRCVAEGRVSLHPAVSMRTAEAARVAAPGARESAGNAEAAGLPVAARASDQRLCAPLARSHGRSCARR